MAVHEAVQERLAANEQRYTPLRRTLVEVLASAGRPLTVPEILDRAPGLPQSSAYRNVTTLIDAGVARRVATSEDHWRVELAEELSGHHHHLVCASCGKVEDIAPAPALERVLADAAQAIGDDHGFVISEHRIELVGVCRLCRAGG